MSRNLCTTTRRFIHRRGAQLGVLAVLLAVTALVAQAKRPAPPPRPGPTPTPVRLVADAPRIDAVFVLDTTGSMSGLIEGAKQKIWSIADEMVSAQTSPDLRIGLVGYRDRGDA
jgi:hypothetical protein